MKTTMLAAFSAIALLGAAVPAVKSGHAEVATPITPQQTAVGKTMVLDSKVVLENAPGSDQAKKMLDKELADLQAIVQRWSDSLTAMKKKYQDDEATLSPAARTSRQKDIDDRLTRYQKGNDSLTGVMQKRQAEVMQPVLDLINKEIGDLRAEEGYAFILDLNADAQLIIAYDKNLDITDRVVARVKKKPAPALPAAKSAAKPGAPPTGAAGVKPPPSR